MCPSGLWISDLIVGSKKICQTRKLAMDRNHRESGECRQKALMSAAQAPMREHARTRLRPDAFEIPSNVFRYVLAESGWHQLVLVVLTVSAFLLEVVPLELQRRIIDDVTKHRQYRLILWL